LLHAQQSKAMQPTKQNTNTTLRYHTASLLLMIALHVTQIHPLKTLLDVPALHLNSATQEEPNTMEYAKQIQNSAALA
jgi:hypothetical protein